MASSLSKEVRQLASQWDSGTKWPKRLEWIEIHGIRGWKGERLEFQFPLVAICGENGMGKSTILQAAVSIYSAPKASFFASQFFPDTPWDRISNASIKYSVREGAHSTDGSVRKPTTRWLGNPERRTRDVRYLDLRRTQPVVVQRGYQKLTKIGNQEAGSEPFDAKTLGRYSNILGREYAVGRHSWTQADDKIKVAVVGTNTVTYSAFHQGAGESTIADLLQLPIPKYSLVAIDEVETSLHPRAQRRLVRDLAEMARLNEFQILLTTHSPYVLEELPVRGRIYVAGSVGGRTAVRGVSPEFAMTNMDDEAHPEGDVFVEDQEARRLVMEILFLNRPDLGRRVSVVPAGSASVIHALGIMVAAGRFPRPTAAVLDGDQSESDGCIVIPGGDAPERIVLKELRAAGFPGIAGMLARPHTEITDAVESAVTLADHHEWIPAVCDKILIERSEFWSACVRSWIKNCLPSAEQEAFADRLADVLQLP